MAIEPWSKGVAVNVVGGSVGFASLGPIPAGIYVERVSVSFLSTSNNTVRLAITRSASAARVVADMVDEDPIFAARDVQISNGPRAILGVALNGNRLSGDYAWGFDVLWGPMWINVAVQNIGLGSMTGAFSVFGFRRIKADEDP